MSYAENTTVPVYRTQNEIRNTLAKYNATAFAFAENSTMAQVQFEMSSRRIKIVMPLPVTGKTKDKKGWLLSDKQVEQSIRSKWRALLLAIKAKLECVDAGITTLEQEFLAHIVLANGQTVGEVALPEIENSYKTGSMIPLLGFR